MFKVRSQNIGDTKISRQRVSATTEQGTKGKEKHETKHAHDRSCQKQKGVVTDVGMGLWINLD